MKTSFETVLKQIEEAAGFIQKKLHAPVPETGIILGSGLGFLADRVDSPITLDTTDIPHWPQSTVSGHRGRLVVGVLENLPVFVMQGRVHFYEGLSMLQVVFPVRALMKLGIKKLIVTNASGGLNPDFNPGDLMLIDDHINLMGTNPLIGPNLDAFGTRFPDMSDPYHMEFRKAAMETAEKMNIPLRRGILIAGTGPTYETAAEVRMLRSLGADAVCMSTVPEVIAGVHGGIKILGISCITNLATGLGNQPLCHEEVEMTASRVREQFGALIRGILRHPAFQPR